MKKAREYATDIFEAIKKDGNVGLDQAIDRTVKSLLDETVFLREQRHCKTDTCLAAILRETNQKWNAICRRVNGRAGTEVLISNGFKAYLLKKMPDLAVLDDQLW